MFLHLCKKKNMEETYLKCVILLKHYKGLRGNHALINSFSPIVEMLLSLGESYIYDIKSFL